MATKKVDIKIQVALPVPEVTTTVVCYNSKCADYRVPRDKAVRCDCAKKKRPVFGAGDVIRVGR